MHFISALVLACLALATAGCSSSQAQSSQLPVASATPTRPHGVSADALAWSGSGIPLDEARKRVGAHVSLPDTATVGDIEKVALDETDVSGTPGLLVLYGSGIKLMIARNERDMTDLGAGAAPFTDGRSTAFELREIDGTQVLVGEAGRQIDSRGGDFMQSRNTWNQGGMAYSLISPSDDVTVDKLIAVMRTMR
jgi:hypothetical protein